MSTHLHESLTYVYHIPTNLAFQLPSRLAFQILPNKRDNLVNSKKNNSKWPLTCHLTKCYRRRSERDFRYHSTSYKSERSIFCNRIGTNDKVREQRIQSRNQLRKQLISREYADIKHDHFQHIHYNGHKTPDVCNATMGPSQRG